MTMNWNEKWFATDAELGMNGSNPMADLLVVANDQPLADVIRLKDAADQGKLIRHAYSIADRGCLLFFLTGIRSKDELLAYNFGQEVGLSARRLVRAWDYGRMDEATVSCVLADHIAARARANEAEERVIQRVQEKLAQPVGV
ncbi:MAG TPA: hypothetical protein VGZ47_07040 [Gemmataceae bacterium]|jgi:hypothetical protein|nr:hypothetical protein [Gemmataceae bacterium]